MRKKVLVALIFGVLSGEVDLEKLISISSEATVRGATVFMDLATDSLIDRSVSQATAKLAIGSHGSTYEEFDLSAYSAALREYYSDF